MDIGRLKSCGQLLRKTKPLFSKFRGFPAFILRCRMAFSADPAAYLEKVDAIYRGLKREMKTIRRREALLLSAVVISEQAEPDKGQEVISRTKRLYRSMRKAHPLLTSKSDLPLAAILALAGKDAGPVLTAADAGYRRLRTRRGPGRRGSVILSLLLPIYPGDTEAECEKIVQICAGLRKSRHTLFGRCSAVLAALADAPLPAEELVRMISEADDYLLPAKPFTGILGIDGSVRKMTAVQIVEIVLNDRESAARPGLAAISSVISTSIEFVIIARMLRGYKKFLRKLFFRHGNWRISTLLRNI